MDDAAAAARRLWALFEPVHVVSYFTAEARAAFEAAGLRGLWRGYFAGRSASIGRAGVAPVIAGFYVFAPAMVSRAVPAVWDLADPAAALTARQPGAVAAIRRLPGLRPGDEVPAAVAAAAELADLLRPHRRCMRHRDGVPQSRQRAAARGHACASRLIEPTNESESRMSTMQRPALTELANPATLPDPYPVLAGLRDASPFAEFDGSFVVAGRHADISAVLRHPNASSERDRSRLSAAAARQGNGRPSFLSLDPPDHTRLRRLVSKAFTPRTIALLEPRIREITGELLTAAAAAGQLEVVSQLAYPLPVRIISEMLGVPVEDHPRFAGWSARLAHSLQPGFGLNPDEAVSRAEAAQAAGDEFAAYFRDLIAARRARPADDLLSAMVRAEDNGEMLTEDELIATCILLLVAGHETTVGLISNAILALLRHPDQLAQLRADPALAASAVEETLRFDAPVQMTARVAKGDLQAGDVIAPDGALILLLLAAAGRDPAAYADPDRFDIRRGATGHLAFAAGPHFCLGAPLARLEATVALQAFATAITAPELEEGSLTYKPNLNLRGPEQMVVRFDALATG